MKTQQLTIFYDGRCPLCRHEMQVLARKDHANKLQLKNLFDSDFDKLYPYVDKQSALEILHGKDESGTLLLGLDVTARAWQLVGRGHWVTWLRWPVIKPVADLCYRFFARHRYSISFLFTGQRRCANGACDITHTQNDNSGSSQTKR